MNREQIERVVETWQLRLGLQNWDLRVEWDKPAGDEANASTWRMDKYDRATMHFAPECDEWDEFFLNWIVVHELLHLCTREIDETHKAIEEHLHRAVWDVHDKRYDHEIEGFIDRLARRLVLIGGTVGEVDHEGAQGAAESEVCGAGPQLPGAGQEPRGEREGAGDPGGEGWAHVSG